MTKLYALVLAPFVLTPALATAWGQTHAGPEIVVVHESGGAGSMANRLYRRP